MAPDITASEYIMTSLTVHLQSKAGEIQAKLTQKINCHQVLQQS